MIKIEKTEVVGWEHAIHKQNNSVDNLEWCTHSENTLHSFRTGLQKKIHNQYGEFEVKKYGN